MPLFNLHYTAGFDLGTYKLRIVKDTNLRHKEPFTTMKNQYLFLLLSIFSLITNAQKQFEFKGYYHPNTNYINVGNSKSTMISDVKTDSITYKKLQEQVAFPDTTYFDGFIKIATRTGALTNDDKTNFTATFLESQLTTRSKDSIQKTEFAKGAEIRGKFDTSQQLEIDTLIFDSNDADMRKGIIDHYYHGADVVIFGTKKLGIGEHFNQTIPFEFPMEGIDIGTIEINASYTLKDIQGDKAYFDLKFNGGNSGDEIAKATCAGNGIMTYDLETEFVSDYYSTFTIDLSITEIEGIEFIMNMVIISDTKFTVEKKI